MSVYRRCCLGILSFRTYKAMDRAATDPVADIASKSVHGGTLPCFFGSEQLNQCLSGCDQAGRSLSGKDAPSSVLYLPYERTSYLVR